MGPWETARSGASSHPEPQLPLLASPKPPGYMVGMFPALKSILCPKAHTQGQVTHIFQGWLQPRHAEDGDPDGHPGAQEVTVLQGVVAEDTQHCLPRLVTGMVELQARAQLWPTDPHPTGCPDRHTHHRGSQTPSQSPYRAPPSTTLTMRMSLPPTHIGDAQPSPTWSSPHPRLPWRRTWCRHRRRPPPGRRGAGRRRWAPGTPGC